MTKYAIECEARPRKRLAWLGIFGPKDPSGERTMNSSRSMCQTFHFRGFLSLSANT